jgi:hypothetical protein
MKNLVRSLAFILLFCLLLLGLATFMPMPVPYYQDFSVSYFTESGLLHGISIYDYPAQLEFVAAQTPVGFNFFPYPYPPWYALSTLFLAWFPIQVAARAWFFLNISMLSLSVWLLTPSWQILKRGLAVLAALLFVPALGLVFVGQYSAPVLLGAALFVHAARHERPTLLALALLLLTFKPHIGGLIFLAGFLWLVWRRAPFAWHALRLTVAGGLLMLALGFLADPAWPLTWLQSLSRYRDLPGVQTCGLCASLPGWLARQVTGRSNTADAALLGMLLALPIAVLLFTRYRAYLRDPFILICMSAILTLILDPYLLNYDYILLLIPLSWLVMRLPCPSLLMYLLSWTELILGRGQVLGLLSSALLAFGLMLFSLASRIDSPPNEAYNQLDN